MTSRTEQMLESLAEQSARLKARLAETEAAIRRGRETADADASEGACEDAGSGKVLPFLRR